MSELDDIIAAHPTYALVRLRDSDEVIVIAGARTDLDQIGDLRLRSGVPDDGPTWDHLLLVPYAQVTERGFEAHDDQTPLSAIAIDAELRMPLGRALEVLPDVPLNFVDRGGFEVSDDDYATLVDQIIAHEIGEGEAANVVIARHYRAKVDDWDRDHALTVFRRLLTRERGAHWTFCIFTGDRFLIGASPERHVSFEAGQVRMNPISGTFRLGGLETAAARKRELLSFLSDEKEIYELFMVVDEELKMMCDICNEGGLILGPFLKPMTHLIHTEYLLAGRTNKDVRQVLRDSMFAATVTGSPVENACRLIKKYEPDGRGYYAAVAALVGRDAQGSPVADAPILIRTADIDPLGNVKVTAGATLVRDSNAAHETKETWAKAGGILSAFGLVEQPPTPVEGFDAVAREDEVLIALGLRNQRLSQFWLSDQSESAPQTVLAGKRVAILDAEDDFVNMLAHIFEVFGMDVDVVRHGDYAPGVFVGYDLVIVGPGPGDPRDANDPKIAIVGAVVDELLAARQPFLAVCLGHQVLSGRLGLELGYKDIVFQGTQSRLSIGGREEVVGFYNTFVARVPASGVPAGVSVESDAATGDIHTICGPHYRGVQFHAESILTQNGFAILRDLASELLR